MEKLLREMLALITCIADKVDPEIYEGMLNHLNAINNLVANYDKDDKKLSSFYVICRKCGSEEIKFGLSERNEDSAGVSIICQNCGEVDGIDELLEKKE